MGTEKLVTADSGWGENESVKQVAGIRRIVQRRDGSGKCRDPEACITGNSKLVCLLTDMAILLMEKKTWSPIAPSLLANDSHAESERPFSDR